MADGTTIYIVDEIRPKPGQGQAFLDHYMESYAPLAVARGMRLEHSWVNPPLWLSGDQQNTLLIVWSVESVSAYWELQGKIRWDSAISDWWSQVDAMVTSRNRLVLGESQELASFTNV